MVSSIQKAFPEVFHIFRGICSQKPQCFSLDKTFCDAWWVTRVKIRVLKILSRFAVCLHIKDRFFVESCILCVQECPSICMFVSNRYFNYQVYLIPWFREHLTHCSLDHNASRDLEFDKNVPRLAPTGALNLKKVPKFRCSNLLKVCWYKRSLCQHREHLDRIFFPAHFTCMNCFWEDGLVQRFFS